MTSTYSANGVGRQILERLSTGPAYYETLRTLGPFREINRALTELRASGAIDLTGAGYEITGPGLTQLAELKAKPGTPKSRVYGESQA